MTAKSSNQPAISGRGSRDYISVRWWENCGFNVCTIFISSKQTLYTYIVPIYIKCKQKSWLSKFRQTETLDAVFLSPQPWLFYSTFPGRAVSYQRRSEIHLLCHDLISLCCLWQAIIYFYCSHSCSLLLTDTTSVKYVANTDTDLGE